MGMAKKLAGECFGTFALVFAGTGAIVINEVTGGGVSHVGIALTFGLIVLAMVYTLGDISGAHINPAVTILLMFVILGVSTGAREKGITAGIVVGSVIGLEALFAGPICGASMNPARSLAPAVVGLHLQSLWVYLLAPTIGALVGVVACRCVREPGCC